jgi:dienelactone hydrolase
MTRVVVLLAMMWLCLGCGAEGVTQVVIILDAEPSVRAQSKDIALVITDATNGANRRVHDDLQSPSERTFPRRIALLPTDGDATRSYYVEARAIADKRTIAVARLLSGYVENQTRYVRMVLEDLCIGQECSPTETCHAGECEQAERPVAGFARDEVNAPVSTAIMLAQDGPATERLPDAATPPEGGATDAATSMPARDAGRSGDEGSLPDPLEDLLGPTEASVSTKGPLAVRTYSEGYRDSPAYADSTIHYPENGTAPFPAVAFVPGYVSPQSSIQSWGPFLASHGIVTITLGTNTTTDQALQRAEALLDALETLRSEHSRPGSPLHGKLDTSRFAVAGWSMGGGGALLAGESEPNLKAVLALCPWNPGYDYSDLTVPTLFFAATADVLAGGQQVTFYESMSASTPKLLWEVSDEDHFLFNDPAALSGAVGRYGLSFLKVFLEGDERYRAFLTQNAPQASDFRTNL